MNSFCSQRTDGYLNFANEHERVFWPSSKKDFYQREKQTIVSAEEKLLLIWIVSVVFVCNSNVSYLNSSCKWDTDAHLNFSDWCSMIKMWFPELYYYILTNLSVYMQEIWNKQICIQCYNHYMYHSTWNDCSNGVSKCHLYNVWFYSVLWLLSGSLDRGLRVFLTFRFSLV